MGKKDIKKLAKAIVDEQSRNAPISTGDGDGEWQAQQARSTAVHAAAGLVSTNKQEFDMEQTLQLMKRIGDYILTGDSGQEKAVHVKHPAT